MIAQIRRPAILLAVCLMGMAGLASAQESLYTDSFNGPAGTRPQNWEIYGATGPSFWFIQDGQFNSGNGDNFDPGYTWAIIDQPGSEDWTDYSISVDFWMPQQVGRVSLALRWKDPGNFYYANLLASRFNQKVEISKYVGGQTPADAMAEAESPSQLQLPKFNQATGPAESHRFEFRAVGNQLSVYLDGQQVLSAVDSTFSSGGAGVGQWYNQVYFDNVVVTAIGDTGIGAVTSSSVPSGPSASNGSGPVTPGVYRLEMAFQLSKQEADDLVSSLSDFPDVEAVQDSDGRYSVYLGKYATQEEARQEMSRYQAEAGLVPQDVQFIPESSSTGAGGGRSRVLVADGVEKQPAEDLRVELLNLGFVPVDVEEGPNGYQVFAGPAFPDSNDAQQMAEELRGTGFLMAEVRQVQKSAAQNLDATTMGASATSEEREKAKQFLQTIQDVEAGTKTYEQLAQERRDNELLSDEVIGMLKEVQQSREEDQKRDRQVTQVLTEMELLIGQKKWDQALAKLEDLKRLRPDHPLIPIKDQSIREARDRDQLAQQSPETRFATLQQQAQQEEQRGNLDQALSIWDKVKTEAREGPFYEEARRNIVRLQEAIAERGGPERPVADEGNESNLKLYIIIGAVATLAIMFVIVLAMVMSKNRKRDEELLRQVEELTHTRDKGKKGSSGKPGAKAAGADKKHKEAAKKDGAPAASTSSVSDSDRIRPGTISPAPAGAKAAPAAEKPAKPAGPTPTPRPGEEEGLKLDFLFGDEKAGEQAAVAPKDSGNQSSTEFVVPPPPEQPPGEAPKGADKAPAEEKPAATAQVDASVLYAQNFEDEEAGKTPKNWRGHYDYANLVIHNGGHGNGSSKCLRFEKKSGIGSAYYSCRFPDAQGRIGVEFDLRCDDKNKYLLGFYIEKDEDFRQSVHTIVHRTSSSASPTLRIQGEPTPYEFGKWCHVRFEIDLPRHIIDGFVNDEAIATGVRLNSCPKVINTLSIRDNLATTGVLLIDNIKIYKL
ncbi:SPOR domain-containing protein [bacterium]|nr:SPOR domain-containing protein [bacterium]